MSTEDAADAALPGFGLGTMDAFMGPADLPDAMGLAGHPTHFDVANGAAALGMNFGFNLPSATSPRASLASTAFATPRRSSLAHSASHQMEPSSYAYGPAGALDLFCLASDLPDLGGFGLGVMSGGVEGTVPASFGLAALGVSGASWGTAASVSPVPDADLAVFRKASSASVISPMLPTAATPVVGAADSRSRTLRDIWNAPAAASPPQSEPLFSAEQRAAAASTPQQGGSARSDYTSSLSCSPVTSMAQPQKDGSEGRGTFRLGTPVAEAPSEPGAPIAGGLNANAPEWGVSSAEWTPSPAVAASLGTTATTSTHSFSADAPEYMPYNNAVPSPAFHASTSGGYIPVAPYTHGPRGYGPGAHSHSFGAALGLDIGAFGALARVAHPLEAVELCHVNSDAAMDSLDEAIPLAWKEAASFDLATSAEAGAGDEDFSSAVGGEAPEEAISGGLAGGGKAENAPLYFPQSPPEADLNLPSTDSSAGPRFFMVKAFAEADVMRSLKYGLWASPRFGHKNLHMAFLEAATQAVPTPVYLVIGVQGTSQIYGVAEMLSPVSYHGVVDGSQLPPLHHWETHFQLRWVLRKDLAFRSIRHLTREAAEARPLAAARDAQEISPSVAVALLQQLRDPTVAPRDVAADLAAFDAEELELMEARRCLEAAAAKRPTDALDLGALLDKPKTQRRERRRKKTKGRSDSLASDCTTDPATSLDASSVQ